MRNHNPYVVALLEIKVSFVSMGNFFESFNRLASKIVDPVGRVGRIWILWNPNNVDIQPVHLSPQAIHVTVAKRNFEDWVFTAVYGSLNNQLVDNP